MLKFVCLVLLPWRFYQLLWFSLFFCFFCNSLECFRTKYFGWSWIFVIVERTECMSIALLTAAYAKLLTNSVLKRLMMILFLILIWKSKNHYNKPWALEIVRAQLSIKETRSCFFANQVALWWTNGKIVSWSWTNDGPQYTCRSSTEMFSCFEAAHKQEFKKFFLSFVFFLHILYFFSSLVWSASNAEASVLYKAFILANGSSVLFLFQFGVIVFRPTSKVEEGVMKPPFLNMSALWHEIENLVPSP